MADGIVFENLHIALDSSNAMLSGLFALFLWNSIAARQRPGDVGPYYRGHLTVAFAYVSASELVHALIGTEWTGSFAWIMDTSHLLRPATWPPSTYFLPLALLLVLPAVKRRVSPGGFAFGLGVLLAALYVISFNVPSYVDTGIAGIQRPFQIPVLPLLAGVIYAYWQRRAGDPLFAALVACAGLLFLSDSFMLWSSSPHDKWAVAAHMGKFFAYLLVHFAMVRQAREDMLARNRVEAELQMSHAELENRVIRRTAELEESRERFAGIVQSAMDAIITIDEEQRIVLFNAAAEAMFGCTKEEALGSSIGRFIPVHSREEHVQYVRDYGSTSVTTRIMGKLGTVSGLRSDGSEFPTEASISKIVVGGHKLYTVILRDISDRVRSSEVIQRLNTDLEKRVALRTAELAQANKELEAFTYAASHDLKGPLGRINTFSDLLERGYGDRLDGDGPLFLDFIRQNATRLVQLVDDLLGHARVAQQTLQLQPVDVPALVQATLKERAVDIRESGAEVILNLTPIQVLADPHSLHQVLINLVENALKYSAQATSPKVEIGSTLADGRCRLWVRDNGIGFDMQYSEKIFEIFHRLHTYSEIPGSGVGLALVKRAMQRMGGDVWAESAPGQGAAFFLELQIAT